MINNKCILLTRPLFDSKNMLNHMNDLGLDCIIEPMIDIEIVENCHRDIDKYQFDNLIVTSANAVRAISQRSCVSLPSSASAGNIKERAISQRSCVSLPSSASAGNIKERAISQRSCVSLPSPASAGNIVRNPTAINLLEKPIYCIGNNTYLEAKNNGFKKPINIDGDVEDLKLHLKSKQKESFLYLSGDVVTDGLSIKEIRIEKQIVYKTNPCDHLSSNCRSYLEKQKVSIVVFYSKRTAEIFNKLANNYDYINSYAVCISEKCALSLKNLNFKEIFISKRPNGESMLELICDISFNYLEN